jgi:hypothetical protein
VAFPFALGVIGIAVIAVAVMLKKNEAALQRRVDAWLPQSLRMAR